MWPFFRSKAFKVLSALVLACIVVWLWPSAVPPKLPGSTTEAAPPNQLDDTTTREDQEPAGQEEDVAERPRVGFTVQYGDVVVPYRVMGLYAMPGEEIEFEAVLTDPRSAFEMAAGGGTVTRVGPKTWRWQAPEAHGHYPLRITNTEADETMTLNAFVLVPFNHDREALNGYRIGDYEARPLKGNPIYNRPEGFVEVTPENRDVRVSPHFTLGQFVCKQSEAYPKYLVLQESLLLKLEMILQEVNEQGIAAETLHIMSGYRTPFYNASIGNRTTYSSHLYGSGADVFVDRDGDNNMDDLNGDGQITTADARVLAGIVESKTDEAWYQPFLGGLGVYSPASHRGPFIHVDVRGQRARWDG